MKHLTGWLSASAAIDNGTDRQSLIEEINRVIKPAQAATSETVFLGLLHAASNEVNVQGGCFDEMELTRLAQLIVDVPVMIGHKKQELPIGRVFKAEVVARDGAPWLRAYFYWHRRQAGAEQLKAGIDAGIYRECSLGFLYGKPECGICGQDMRNCRHRIHEAVRVGSREIKAFYYYRKIERVLEVSLVSRGAVAGTSVSTLHDSGGSAPPSDPFWRQRAAVRFELDQLAEVGGDLTVEPLYRGIWLALTTGSEESAALMPSGQRFEHPLLATVADRLQNHSAVLVCQLVAMRGSSRLPIRALLRGPSRVRARLIVFDLAKLAGQSLTHLSLAQRRDLLADLVRDVPEIDLAPAQTCSLAELSTQPERYGTLIGMRIVVAGSDQSCLEYRRKPALKVRLNSSHGSASHSELHGELLDGSHLQLESAIDDEMLRDYGDGVVWVEPTTGNLSRYRIFDLALGESQPDDIALASLAPAQRLGKFVLLLDNHGNGWLHLQRAREERLFKIAMLRLPLLQRGRRFWSALLEMPGGAHSIPADVRILDRGTFDHLASDEKVGVAVTLSGATLRDRYQFVRTKLSGHRAFLFSQARTAIAEDVVAESEDRGALA